MIGRLQEALADCNEALKLKPDYINALDSRGFVQLRMGKYDEAIADYDAALQIDAEQGRLALRARHGEAPQGRLRRRQRRHRRGEGLKPNVIAEFARYGLLPPLTEAAARPELPAGRAALARGRKAD